MMILCMYGINKYVDSGHVQVMYMQHSKCEQSWTLNAESIIDFYDDDRLVSVYIHNVCIMMSKGRGTDVVSV